MTSANPREYQESPPKKRTPNANCAIADPAVAWWRKLGDDTQVLEEAERPLIVNIAGFPCVDWSQLGGQARDGGLRERHQIVWHEERAYLARHHVEDLFFSECSSRYPMQARQQRTFEDTHKVVSIKVSPHSLGHPMRRERNFSAGLNRNKYVWVGPESHDEVQRQFDEFFGRTLEVTGDVYMVAPDDEVESYVMELAAKRKLPLPPQWATAPMKEYLHLIVDRTNVQHFRVYDQLVGERGSIAGAHSADLEQSPDFYGSGPHMPPLNTHSVIFDWKKQRLATPMELVQAMGVDSFPEFYIGRPRSRLADCLAPIGHKGSFKQLAMASTFLHLRHGSCMYWATQPRGKMLCQLR